MELLELNSGMFLQGHVNHLTSFHHVSYLLKIRLKPPKPTKQLKTEDECFRGLKEHH